MPWIFCLMVTKSIMSSPPRIRGEPIDIQEIEVELSSTKYPSSRSTKSASASNSISDPNPAAPTPSPPNVNKQQIRNPAAPQKAGQTELNDREPLKETAAAKSESPKVTKGKQVPSTPPTEEKAMLAPEIKEDTTEPSVVEVQLSNSPKSHASAQKSSPPKIQSVKSSATSVAPTSKPNMLTKNQRATSLPAAKTSNVAAAAVITAAAAANAIKSKTANKSTSTASVSKAMASTKALTTSATKSTNATAGSFAATKKSTSAIVAKSPSPNVESGAKSAISTVESAAKPPASAGTCDIKSVSPTVVSVSKSSSPTVASTIASTVASSATTSIPATSPIPVGTTLTKSPSVPKMTSGQTRSIAAAPSLTKSPSSAAKLVSSKTISHAKPPAPIFVPITPPATKTESRFRLGRSKTGRVNGQVVRDGKLCHVRLTLAFLTGITAERLPEYQHLPLTNSKKYAASSNSKSSGINTLRPPADELVPIGFAMLSQGDGTMALSHPMKPFDFASNVPRQTLIWTDNSDSMSLVNTLNEDDHDLSGDHDDESQLTHSAGQRRLYFEVSLNRESESSVPPEQNNDLPDDATATSMLKEVAANYSPELVSIVVGLKKGEDQVISLGIATLVVSGREVSGQHVDLPVRPLTLAERETYSLDSSDKKKRKGPAFRLFGVNKRAEASLYSFKNEHHSYSLAPNATLRVRLDVRSGIYREHGPALWGDILIPRPDDESRGTVTVYDLSTQGDRETVKRSLIPLDDRHEYVEVLPNANGTTIISSPGGALGLSSVYSSQHSKLQGRDDESLQTRFEVTSIFAGSTDVRSVESTSEQMSLLERLENAGICGALDKLDDQALSSSNSFASTLPDIDPPELDSVQSALSVGDKLLAEIPSSTSKNSKSASRVTQTSVSSAPLNAVEDDDDDEVVAGVFCSGGASKSSGADSSTEEGTRTSATTRSVGTRSVGDETYQKVMEAKETLMRYASRVGVEMEDLLDEDDSTLRRRGSSSFSGSTNISR